MSTPLSLADAFLAIHLRFRRHMDAAMTEAGLSLARYRFLAMLHDHGPCRAMDMATHFAFAPRSVTEAIDALEREGLATRVPDPSDRRAKLVSITPAGEALLEVSGAYRERAAEEVFGSLDAAQREQLQALLGTLRRRLDGT